MGTGRNGPFEGFRKEPVTELPASRDEASGQRTVTLGKRVMLTLARLDGDTITGTLS